MSRISLHKIQLFQFKNYDAYEAHFGPRVNCLLGKNGIGKTNILDAIYSLSFCKSYFSHTDSFSIQDGKEQGAVNGEYELDAEPTKISYALFRDKKKQVSKNGKTYERLSEHIGVLPLVMVTPNDIDLIREASDVRRRWLDQTLSQTSPEYLRLLILFNHILDQRNAVLKNNNYSTTVLAEIISIYNEQINFTGTQIFQYRCLKERFESLCFPAAIAAMSVVCCHQAFRRCHLVSVKEIYSKFLWYIPVVPVLGLREKFSAVPERRISSTFYPEVQKLRRLFEFLWWCVRRICLFLCWLPTRINNFLRLPRIHIAEREVLQPEIFRCK